MTAIKTRKDTSYTVTQGDNEFPVTFEPYDTADDAREVAQFLNRRDNEKSLSEGEKARRRMQEAENILRAVLIGARGAATKANPTAAGMPAFDWKLDDAQIAAIATYVRNSEGNAASAVSAEDVAEVRAALLAREPLRSE